MDAGDITVNFLYFGCIHDISKQIVHFFTDLHEISPVGATV